jgi:hypothetical protein
MRRFWLFLGILLQLISCPLLIMALQDPADSLLGGAFSSVICHSDEELSQYLGSEVSNEFGRNTGRSLSFYCINSAGVERDVTLSYVMLMAGVFVVPFVFGMIITIITSTRMIRGKANQFIGQALSQTLQQENDPQQSRMAAEIMETGISTTAQVTFVDRNYRVLINNRPVYSIVEYVYQDDLGNKYSKRIDRVSSEAVIRNQIAVGSTVDIKYSSTDPSQSIWQMPNTQ